MTIRVEITPEAQAELARQAAAQGRPVEAYAASLLEEVALHPAKGRLSLNRAEKMFHDMAQFSDKIPSLPDEALTRESFYRDHD